MDMNAVIQNAGATLVAVAWKVAGAVVLWLIGRWLITFSLNIMGKALAKQQFDLTLSRYTQTALSILLNVALAVAIRRRRVPGADACICRERILCSAAAGSCRPITFRLGTAHR